MSNAPSQPPTTSRRKSSTSTPSLFATEYSRGPLYQYMRERNREAIGARVRRVSDAKERASGRRPLSPQSGPSSNSEYQARLDRGLVAQPTPVYEEMDSHATVRREEGVMGEDLPAYEEGRNVNAGVMAEGTSLAMGQAGPGVWARDEKGRLQRHFAEEEGAGEGNEDGNDVMQESAPEVMGAEGAATGKGKGKGRKKSIGKGMGNFFGRAFTGYGLKSDGKMNENRW